MRGGEVSRFQIAGLGLLAAFLFLGLASFAPVFETHYHVSESEEVVLVPRDADGPLEQAVEPAYDLYQEITPRATSAHSDFDKYCGHDPAMIPNHAYYPKNAWWNDGTHYHTGLMSHVVGADYNYKFVCGRNGNHWSRWP
jgi:hypothetical protein